MNDTHISFGDRFDAFIGKQVKSGRYASENEVVRAGLILLEEYESKVEALRQAITEGIESGICEDFSLEKLLQEVDELNADQIEEILQKIDD